MELQDYVEKLKALEVYDQFANNLKAKRFLTVDEYYWANKEFLNGSFKTFLLDAFSWGGTPEGFAFWSKIANS